MIKRLLLIVAMVAPLMIAGCDRDKPDPEFSIIIENNLLSPVDVFLNGLLEISIDARTVGLIEELKPGTYQLDAYSNGAIVKSEAVTSEDADITWIIN